MKTLALTSLLLASLFRPALGKEPIVLTCDGTSKVTLPAGTYEVLVEGGTAHECLGAETCPSGGVPRVPGNHGLVLIQAPTNVSCRSDLGATMAWVPGVRL